jgi:hypothetical protein
LVLSPTGLINLGFTTEGRLAAVLIITFSWGFQQVFWRQLRANKTAITLQITARSAGANNIHTLLCIQQDKTSFNNSQINSVFIITIQANNTTSTSNCSQKIQQVMDQQYNIVFQTIQQICKLEVGTTVVHAISTILP